VKAKPFVGRTAELNLLQQELAATEAGTRLVLVSGEAGAGKSRLIGEFQTLARVRGRCLLGRGSPLGTAIPFSIVAEALETHLRTLLSDQVAALCPTRLAALRDVLPSVGAAIPAAPAPASRIAIFEAFVCLLEAIARDRPLALLLDDADRGDPSTWELLHYLARNAPRARILVVASVRSSTGIGGRDLVPALALLLKDELATEVRLRPLGREDLVVLASQMLGEAGARSTLTDWLHERTNGNAFFAVALLDELAADPDRRELPTSVRAHIEELTASLDADARHVLEIAAVLGHSFRLRTIAQVIPLDSAHWLDELSRRGLLHERAREGMTTIYDFGHPLMQEVMYESVGAAKRRELHERIANVLVDEPLAVRAYHAARGALPGDHEALALVREAAREAERAEAHGEALQHLVAALELVAAESEERSELLDEIGWQAAEAGDHVVGIPALRELLDRSRNDRERGVVHMRLASLLASGAGDLATAEREASEAVTLFERSDATADIASAINELAWIRGEAGQLDEQIAGSRDALRRAEARGDDTAVLHSLGSLGYALALRGDTDAISSLERSVGIAKKIGDRGQTGWHVGTLGLALLTASRPGDAMRVMDGFLDAGPAVSSVAYQHRALVNWIVGRWQLALDDCRAAEALHASAMPVHSGWIATLAGLMELAQDRDAAARPLLAQGERMYATRDFYWFGAIHHWAFGCAHALMGDVRVARERTARAAQRLADMDATAAEPLLIPDLVDALIATDETTAAADAASRAATLARQLDTAIASAYAAYAMGAVRSAQGRRDEARAALRSAADAAESSGLRPLRARALVALARTLDGSEALAAFTEAAQIYGSLPAPRHEAKVVAEMRLLGSAGRRSAQAVGDLTGREREVVALVRSGLANREIAERLHLSERTIETHLAHIYGKLGVSGRREL